MTGARARFVVHVLPGLLLTVACAIAARLLHGLLPPRPAAVLGEVVVVVLLGLVIGNAVMLRPLFAPGIRFSFHSLLRVAIVILGAQFSFFQVVAIGGKAVLMIVILMALALTVAHVLGRLTGVPGRLATLIGVGTAVCGNTAITATAPVIRAEDGEVSFAVATNTLFGTAALFIYPVLGHWIALSRPGFVLRFLLAAFLNTLGAIAWAGSISGRDLSHDLQVASRFLILVALSGVGLSTRVSAMKRIGATPFLVGFATAATTALASYLLIRWLGPAGG